MAPRFKKKGFISNTGGANEFGKFDPLAGPDRTSLVQILKIHLHEMSDEKIKLEVFEALLRSDSRYVGKPSTFKFVSPSVLIEAISKIQIVNYVARNSVNLMPIESEKRKMQIQDSIARADNSVRDLFREIADRSIYAEAIERTEKALRESLN
jgi:hypothetical protein